MKIVACSDLHGFLPDSVPSCDLFTVAGDLGPPYNWYHKDYVLGSQWILGPFYKWMEQIDAKHKIVIAGNHDFVLEKNQDLIKINAPFIYLQEHSVEIEGFKIFGTPYTPTFFDWAFMKPDNDLIPHWKKIPDDTQILITHGPPFGKGDWVKEDVRMGSFTLLDRVKELKKLKLHIFGHNHKESGYFDGVHANVSICNKRYKPTNPVREFTLV